MRFNFDSPEGWGTNPSAVIVANPTAPTQPNSLHLIYGSSPDPSCVRTLTGLVVGQSYEVWVRVNFDGDANGSAHVTIAYNDSPAQFSVTMLKPYDEDLGQVINAGWELRYLGMLHYTFADRPFRITGAGPASVLATVDLDEIFIGEAPPPVEEDEDMVKLNEIWDALVASVQSVTIANGYALNVDEVVEGPVNLGATNGAVSVQIFFPDEDKTNRNLTAIGRKTVEAQFVMHVVCKKTETTSPGRQCIEACGAIEKAIEAFDGQFLALGYVTHVFTAGSVSDDYPPEIARDVRVRALNVLVSYAHERRNP